MYWHSYRIDGKSSVIDNLLAALCTLHSSLLLRVTAGCIDTGLPAGRRYFGHLDKPLIETANVHHARWVMSTETRCKAASD